MGPFISEEQKKKTGLSLVTTTNHCQCLELGPQSPAIPIEQSYASNPPLRNFRSVAVVSSPCVKITDQLNNRF